LLKNNKIYTLRGVIVTDEDLDDDVVKIFEITYENHILRSLSVQYEYTYRSTMRQSNYISGVHYYFGETMIGEFPPLNTFYE
jgi:hypothetical protein